MLSSNKLILFFEDIKNFNYDLDMALAASTLLEDIYIILSKNYHEKLSKQTRRAKQLKGLKALGIKIIIIPSRVPSGFLKIKNANLINYNELVDLIANSAG